MTREIPALLSLIGLVTILYIWYIFIFVAQPEGASAFEAALQQATSAFDPDKPGSIFFIGTLVSALLCLASAVLFLTRKPKVAVGLVATNTLIAVFLFSHTLVFGIGLPLLLAPRVWKHA